MLHVRLGSPAKRPNQDAKAICGLRNASRCPRRGQSRPCRDDRYCAQSGRHRKADVRKGPILLQKSKIERPEKSRQSGHWTSLPAASLSNATTEVRDRFGMKRHGPSRRRAQNASAALGIFVRHLKKTFATISALSGRWQFAVCPPCARSGYS